jgi:hypothetical protein
MLITETQRSELLARVLRKEYLAKLCEEGKITPEDYIQSINAIRADEQLSPLTVSEAVGMPRRVAHRRSRRKAR